MMALATALLLTAALQGPGAVGPAVQGVVRSTEDRAPIAYAHVQVLGDSVSDWTDGRGAYRLEGLPRGRWRIRVVHPAHDTLNLEIFVPGDRDVTLDLALDTRPGPAPEPLADFEPFQVEYTLPALLNSDEVTALIRQAYPPDLARRGIGGEAVLRLWLDEQGHVVRGLLSSSSGERALDALALSVSDRMRFRPAKNRDDAVRVIVRIPVLFTVPDAHEGGDPGDPGGSD